MWCAVMAVLGLAQNDADEDAARPPAATSSATISVLDAARVISRFTWWGVDLAMESAGYGKRLRLAVLIVWHRFVCRVELAV